MKEEKQLSVKELAKIELLEEMQEKSVGKLKVKLEELLCARQVVKNLEREVADLEEELQQEFDDISE